jgi:hypothetical protein
VAQINLDFLWLLRMNHTGIDMATRQRGPEFDAIRAKMRIKPIEMQASRPSITRNDAACAALRRAGLDADTLAADVRALRQATIRRSIWVYGGNGEKGHSETIEEPDYRTRLEGAKLQVVIEGWQFSPQKAQDQHPLVLILNQLPEEIRTVVEQSIENRLRGLLKPGIN